MAWVENFQVLLTISLTWIYRFTYFYLLENYVLTVNYIFPLIDTLRLWLLNNETDAAAEEVRMHQTSTTDICLAWSLLCRMQYLSLL